MNKSLNGFPLAPSLAASANAEGAAGNAATMTFKAVAGADIKADDALLITRMGLVVPAKTVEYAGYRSDVNFSGGTGYNSKRRHQVVVDPKTGDVYFVGAMGLNAGNPNGIYISRVTPRAAMNDIVTVFDDPGTLNAAKLFWLSNGNLCVVWDTGTDKFHFAIYTKDLIPVVAPTIIGALGLSGYFDAIPLAAGGFAVCYIAGTDQKLAIFGNDGIQTGATVTVNAWGAGASNYQIRCSLAQLSSGAIAIACIAPNDLNKGVWAGVRSAAGALISAMARIYQPPGAQSEINPEIAAVDGFFAVASTDTANTKLWVFNNAGVLQGAPFTSNVGNGAVAHSIKLLPDGADFVLVGQRSVDLSRVAWTLTRAKTTGADYRATDVISLGNYKISNINSIDAFIDRGLLVVAQNRTSVTVNLADNTVVWEGGNWFSSSYGGIAIAPWGDFMAVALVNNGTSQMYGGGRNFMPSAIAGVAAEDAAKGAEVTVKSGVGFYKINPCRAGVIYGAVNFDRTSNNDGEPAMNGNGGGFKGWIGQNTLFIRSL